MIDLDAHLGAIRLGDPEAFGLWMAGAEDPLRRSLHSFAGTIDSESIVQETLLRVWNLAPRIEPTGPNSLLRFALRTARNLAIDEVRRARRFEAPEREDVSLEIPSPGPSLPDPFLRARIRDCLERLPPRPRAALDARLQAAGGRPDRDLARAVRMSLNTFHQNFGRARRLLLECLRQYGIEVA